MLATQQYGSNLNPFSIEKYQLQSTSLSLSCTNSIQNTLHTAENEKRRSSNNENYK